MVDALFRSAGRLADGGRSRGRDDQGPGGPGGDAEAAQACFANDRLLDKVLADVQSGQTLGVQFTPTLFINEQNYGNPGDGRRDRSNFAPGGAVIRLTPHRHNSQDVVERKTDMRNILIVAGGVVAVAAIAAGVYFGTRPPAPGPAPTAVAAAATPTSPPCSAVQPGDHVLGDPNAPITLIEYASLTCPHCAALQHSDPARAQEEVDRHRQGEADLPRLPARPGRRQGGPDRRVRRQGPLFRRDRHDLPRPAHLGDRVRSDRRARQVAAHRRHGRDRGQGLPRQRGDAPTA